MKFKNIALPLVLSMVVGGACTMKTNNLDPVDFALIGTSDYNYANVYNQYGVTANTPFSHWEYIRSQNHYNTLCTEQGIDLSAELNFDTHSYIISYGREILEIWENDSDDAYVRLGTTFSEQYYGHKAFIYETENIPIYPFSWDCYIMEDENKKYWGSNSNEINDTGLDSNAP